MRKVVFLLLASGIVFVLAYSAKTIEAFSDGTLGEMKVVSQTEVPFEDEAEAEPVAEGADVAEETGMKPAVEQPAAEPNEDPAYWVGVLVQPVPTAIRAQIPEKTLAAGSGLFIAEILPDSPAAKSDLKQFDIVTKIDGAAVSDPNALVNAVATGGGKALQLEVLRAGELSEVALQPEQYVVPFRFPAPPKRPMPGRRGGLFDENFRGVPRAGSIPMRVPQRWKDNNGIPPFDIQIPEGIEIPEEARELLGGLEGAGSGMIFRLIPGTESNGVVSRIQRSVTTVENGKRFSITVLQDENDVSKVRVEWGGEVYEAQTDDLSPIPEQVRDKVKTFVESGSISIRTAPPAE